MTRSMIAEIHPKPGQEEHVLALITALAREVRREAGNLAFLPYRRAESPTVFEILEAYQDEAAFQRHLGSGYVKVFNEALKTAAIGGVARVRDLEPALAVPPGPPPAPPPAPMARGLDHVGLTVPDIEEAAAFFVAAFGAVAIYDVQPKGAPPMAGAETEKQLDLPKGARILHMRLMRIGDSASPELFKIDRADQGKPVGLVDFGLTHIGLYVDDIEAAAKRFEKAGGTLLSPPHGLAGVEDSPGNAGVYGRAPWGTLIELLTYPGGIRYAPDAGTLRWTPKPPLVG